MKNITIMKHLVLLSFFLVFASCMSFAQLVETYPTSQRYLFNRYIDIGLPVTCADSHVDDSSTGVKGILYSKYREDANISVYGIAIPLMTCVDPSTIFNPDTSVFYNIHH